MMLSDVWERVRKLVDRHPWMMPVGLFVLGIVGFFVCRVLLDFLDKAVRANAAVPILLSAGILCLFSWWQRRTVQSTPSIRIEPAATLPTYQEFAGLEEFREEMRTVAHRNFGLDPRAAQLKIQQKGVLLFGGPGGGKSHFVRCLAGETGADLIHLRTSDMQSTYVGGISKAVAEVFEFCRRYTADGKRRLVLFLDEMEGIAANRGASEAHAEVKKGVQTLLACIDESHRYPNFLLVGATNHQEEIDDAVKRDGRFDVRKAFPLPDGPMRGELFKKFLRDRTEATAGGFDLDQLVTATQGRSVAEIQGFLQRAAALALKENVALSHAVLMQAIQTIRPDAQPPEPLVPWEQYVGDASLVELGRKIAADLKNPVPWGKAETRPIGSVLLHSDPGMGKTYWVKAVATDAGANFYEVNSSTIATKWIGDAEVKIGALFKRARDNRPSIVFLDEIDSIAPRRGAGDAESNISAVNNRIVNSLLTELDGAGKSNSQLLIIAATNRYDAIDDAIKRPGRFMKHVFVPPPDEDQREALFRLATAKAATDPGIDFRHLAKASNHFSNDDVVGAARLAVERAKSRAEAAGETLLVRQEDLRATIDEIRYRGMVRPSREQFNWDTIIVPQRTREDCQLALRMLTDIEFLEKSGLTPPLGIIFDGPPGTGKTALAMTMAAESGAGFFQVQSKDILAADIASTVRKIHELKHRAIKASPCILFFDEIDGLCSSRQDQASLANTQLVNALLQMFNDVRAKARILVIGATNDYDALDEAIVRPGRLEQRIPIGPPDTECRERLWRLYLGNVAGRAAELQAGEVPSRLVADSEGLSAAEIMGAVEASKRDAVLARMRGGQDTPIRLADLLANVQKIVRSRTKTPIMERPSREKYNWTQVVVDEATQRDCRLSLALLTNPDLALSRGITPPLGVIFEGPPGTGKTLLAKTMAAEAGVNYFELRKDHFEKGVGEITAQVQQVFGQILRSLPALVFLDECENLLASREEAGSDLVNAFLTALNRLGEEAAGRVLVVGATNFYSRIDKAVVRAGRLEKRITIGLPDAPRRRRLWKMYLERVPASAWDPSDPVPDHLEELVDASARRSPAEIRSALEGAKMLALGREFEQSGAAHVLLDDLLAALQQAGKGETSDRPDRARYNWDNLILPESVIAELRLAIQLLTDRKLRREEGIDPDLGILLSGPPGTGKTLAAKTMAAMAGAAFIEKQASELLSKYTGETEKNIARVFENAADAAPCIVFFDEIESLVPDRGRLTDEMASRGEIVNQFLASMNRAKEAGGILVIGATNHPERVDPAIARSGRLGQHVEIGLPDAATLERLWTHGLTRIQNLDSTVRRQAGSLAKKSAGLSPADVDSVIAAAQRAALIRRSQTGQEQSVTATDLQAALQRALEQRRRI